MRVHQIPPKKKRSLNLSVTVQLIIANIVFFVSMLFFSEEFVIKFIAIDPFYILKGKYLWTFLSSMFMHGGVLHLFVNMLSLVFVGSLVERLLGRKRYFWFYIISGIFAGLFFILFYFVTGNLGVHVPAVGASGALFALIGILMILTPNLKVYAMFIPIPIKMKYAAPGLLIILWAISIVGKIGIGNLAHLGGFLIGIVYGLYLRRKFPKKTKYIRKRFT
jgi:uncharacterized protein